METSVTRKVLVLGASGMLGNAMLRVFASSPGYAVIGSVRATSLISSALPAPSVAQIVRGVDLEKPDSLIQLFADVRPDVVINCIGLVKQLAEADDPLVALPINAMLPHRLARLCGMIGARLIHISTDCVFSGAQGMYRETDRPDAVDLYGQSKHLGEVDYPHAITLRTSIIGHELGSPHGLLGWFLSQNGRVKGFTNAIFSGLPTCEMARIIRDFVLPRPELHGVHHVSAAPITKFDLLKLIADVYAKSIEIEPDPRLVIDRSLDSSIFRRATGYAPPDWRELILQMRQFG